ncbi:Nop domain-containing protein [Ophiobolus disseminans]|uniref:Nop domain-containing protein n=1 Tax=Ophiobolus disseminans TaxID=1469910 RepID=A0A6A7AK06_9PLEO|nr:Nop domain-containing protein [Ophiobolus disseminans]
MATLEQELMADFADSGDEDYGNDLADSNPTLGDDDEDQEMVDEEAEYAKKKQQSAPTGTRGAQTLYETLQPVLERLSEAKDQMEVVDDDEDSEAYALLEQANEYSTQIDGEVHAVHKYIMDIYEARFPGLSTLVRNPRVYAKSVAIIQNGPLSDLKSIAQSADNVVGVPLKGILSQAELMVVVVEGTRTQGRDLSDAELSLVVDACKLLLHLDEAKDVLLEFVQSRMTSFAPNLTALLGPETAAKLISTCSGIQSLAKTPSCNLAPLGSNKASGLGLATNIGVRDQGYLYHSPIVQSVRQDLRKQAMRIVAGKAILCARVDAAAGGTKDNSTGIQFKDDCERRIAHLSAVPANKGQRALPAPDERTSKKRGGRRARAQKASNSQSELAKAQNRMVFGKEEKEVGYGDSTRGMGMIGATDTGRLRAQQIDPKTRAKLSKKQGAGWGGDTTLGAASSIKGFGGGGTATSLRAHGLRTGGVGLGGAGTSSIAFTPVQGLELVDPRAREEASRKRKADEDRWFKGGSFTQLGGASKMDAGGFKVPALPNKKPKTES